MNKIFYSIGKRKRSRAVINLKKKKLGNKNKIFINNKEIDKYFINNKMVLGKIYLPLLLTKNFNNNLEINIVVRGGGVKSQIDSIVLGLSRILVKIKNSNIYILKRKKLLTRDSRKIERKKYGMKKSRKKFQFSKR